MSRKTFRDLAPPARAHEVIAGLDLATAPESVELTAARGRILAERIDAAVDVPGFDRASMDGFAVRARETFGADEADPVSLSIVGAVHAGERPSVTVDPGTAAEISTGAVMPEGADAVVKVERTTRKGETVEIETAVAPTDHVMVSGADIAAGTRGLGPGTQITPREIGLLSALGIDEVPVLGIPTVGIVSTGDELVRPGATLDHRAGQIYDVNSYSIAASVEEAGGESVLYPHAGDDRDELERILLEAADDCELVVSSGSTSAGAVDVIYRVIEERGELLLHGVAVKPGKPMLVGSLGGSAYIGLPGYPVSALTIFRTFVAPALRDAAGLPDPPTGTVTGTMATRERYREGRLRLMPVGLVENGAGETLVYPVDKGSGATTSLVEADGIVEVAADTEFLEAGESVDVRLFSPGIGPPSILGVGEDDPLLWRVLDDVPRPRYLPMGSREGRRRLTNGVPDMAVTSGPSDREVEARTLGGWSREWGLIVPPGNPESVDGLRALVDRELRFVNRHRSSGLRASLDEAIESLAVERGMDRATLVDDIDGYEFTVAGVESPARKVAAGHADVGVGLRVTASDLGLGYVPLGEEPVVVLANPDRLEKSGVRQLRTVLEDIAAIAGDLDGIAVG